MNCISRNDKDKNIFVVKTNLKGRWNLYSQIAIENDMLVCATKKYKLTDICRNYIDSNSCTLLDSNEVVDISYDPFS